MNFKRLLFSLLFFSISNIFSQEAPFFKKSDDIKNHGFSKQKLDTLVSFLKTSGSSSLIIISNKKTILEWGTSQKKHTIHSIRKAVLNSLLGIYITNGTIDTTQTIASLKIDDIVPLSKLEKTATIADLLKSRSGIYHHAAAVSKGMLAKMPKRETHKPNEAYYYNNWGFNVLGYILEIKTGKSIYDLFYEHIAKPIGMSYQNKHTKLYVKSEDENDIDISNLDGFYQYELEKSKYPAYHFRLSARDLALYGQLYLNEGNWNGKQLIPKEWITLSTQPINITYKPAGLAYGILWGVLMKTKNRSSKSFYHTGTGVHMLAVYPASKMILIHRVDTEKEYDFAEKKLYKMIDLVWNSKEN
jgi:CubicO group peptidase (beta-lactamase class C family)